MSLTCLFLYPWPRTEQCFFFQEFWEAWREPSAWVGSRWPWWQMPKRIEDKLTICVIKERAVSLLKMSKARFEIFCALFIVGASKARWIPDFNGCCLRLIQSLGRLGKNLTMLAVPRGCDPAPEAAFYSIRISISVVKDRCTSLLPSILLQILFKFYCESVSCSVVSNSLQLDGL